MHLVRILVDLHRGTYVCKLHGVCNKSIFRFIQAVGRVFYGNPTRPADRIITNGGETLSRYATARARKKYKTFYEQVMQGKTRISKEFIKSATVSSDKILTEFLLQLIYTQSSDKDPNLDASKYVSKGKILRVISSKTSAKGWNRSRA